MIEDNKQKHRNKPNRMSDKPFCRIGKGSPASSDHLHQKILLGTCTSISFVNFTSLCVCRNQRILIHKTF